MDLNHVINHGKIDELRPLARRLWADNVELQRDNIELAQKVKELKSRLDRQSAYIRRLERALDDALVIVSLCRAGVPYGRVSLLGLGMSERAYDNARALMKVAGVRHRGDMLGDDMETLQYRLIAALQRAEGNPQAFHRRRQKRA